MAFFDKIAAKLGLHSDNSVKETTGEKRRELNESAQTDKELQAGLNGGELLGVGDDVEIKTNKNVLKKAEKYVADWWTDNDKVSTDGADDGKISKGEYAESYAKGLVGGLAKSFKEKPVKTAATVLAIGAGCVLAAAGVVATGIVSAPVTAVAAVIGGVVGLGFAAAGFISHGKQSKEAVTDGEKKAAAEGLGTDTALAALSFLGLKGGIKGVKGAKIKQNTEAVQKTEVETKPASEVKPAEEVQNAAPKYSPEEIAAFNESKGVTSAKIEHRYTGKTSQTVENGYERSISGESEVEQIYDNKNRLVKETGNPKPMGLDAAQRKAVLDKAGFTEEVIQQMERETVGSYSELVPRTLDMIEYLESRIANGEKLTSSMIKDAIRDCDDRYAQAGYGSAFQDLQKGILDKYWARADEVREAYHKEGNFFTEAERVATRAAQRKAVLDKAGFTEEVIQQMERETVGSYSELVPRTLDMIEYLESRIANGEKLTSSMIKDAIRDCDDRYAQAGYGRSFQNLQLGLLARYWSHGKELGSIMK